MHFGVVLLAVAIMTSGCIRNNPDDSTPPVQQAHAWWPILAHMVRLPLAEMIYHAPAL